MAQSPRSPSRTNTRVSGPAPAGPWRIQVAAELCGIAPATLRAWERRYGIPVPRRTASAYRLYTADDVELIRRMRALVESGVSPAEASREVLAGSPPAPAPESAASTEPDAGLELARERLLAATLRFDAVGIDAELARLSMLLDAVSLYERVVSPLLEEVGKRWEAGEVSVAQEHMISERVEYALRALLRTLDRHDGPLVLAACIEDEQHVLGMLGAALKLAASGARVVVLGAATPPSAVRAAVASMRPRLVALSVCLAPERARALMKAYGSACGDVPWVVGGTAATALEPAITSAGGLVARGSAPEWQVHVREWLRGGRHHGLRPKPKPPQSPNR